MNKQKKFKRVVEWESFFNPDNEGVNAILWICLFIPGLNVLTILLYLMFSDKEIYFEEIK